MTLLLAIATLIAQGQVPDSVTNEAMKLVDKGGYGAALALSLAANGALAFVCWKLYGAVRDMAKEQLAFSNKAVESSVSGQAVTRDQIEAMKSLAQEVRAK